MEAHFNLLRRPGEVIKNSSIKLYIEIFSDLIIQPQIFYWKHYRGQTNNGLISKKYGESDFL